MAKSLSKTPAPKKDRIFGSDKNKKGSASSKASAKGIDLNDSIIETLSNKAKEYNEKHPNSKVSVTTLKAVMRRGMGAYSTSHRPTITGGAPNSRQAWGFARVNKFLKKKAGQQVKAAYVQDDDLMEKGGFIAPNGKPSNLTAEQYKLVRTPQFKAWFGDWENDPQNASKVVDENGEPLVVYHGSNKKFNVFKNSEDGSFGKGIYFHADKNIANGYTDKYDTNSTIYNVFLNIKKPYIFFEKIDGLGNPTFYEKFLKDEDLRWSSKSDFYATKNLLENYDGAFYSRFEKLPEKYKKTNLPKLEYVVYFPNQIKLADGTNKTFDMNNPDIRYADGGETKKSKDAYTIVAIYRDPKTNDYRESEDLTQDGLIGYRLRYNKAPMQYYGYVGYDNTESELERAKRDLDRYNKEAEEEKERKKLKDIENKIKREKQKIIDAQKLEVAKSNDSAKPAYLMTNSEYQDRVVPLLKEYEKFTRKNSEYLSDTAYSGFYKVTFEQVLSRGLEGKKTGYYFRNNDEKELIENWNERKFRKYDDQTIPKPTPKDILEKNVSFLKDLNKFFDENVIFDGLNSDYKKSNKAEIRRAIEDDTYKKMIENGEITEDEVIKIAEEQGVKVPKKVFSQESLLKKEAKKQMDEILSKIPKMNQDIFDSLYKQLYEDFKDVEKIVFERETERFEGLIKEYIELSKKEGGVNVERLEYNIVFFRKIFKSSEPIVIRGKDSRGYPTSQYFQKDLELKSDYKPIMDKINLDYAESLKYRFLKAVLDNFPMVSKPISDVTRESLKVGKKGFEGRYRFNFADGSYFDFVTEAIPAAGYNIVAFHYRYLTHLENATLADGTKVKGYYEIMDKFSSKSMADGGEVGLTEIAQDVYISKDKDKLPKDATIVIHRYNDDIKAGELGLFAGNLEDMELDDGYGKNKAYISIGKNAKLKKIRSTSRYLEDLGEFDKPREYIQEKYGYDSLLDLMDDAGILNNPSDAWYETQKVAISKMREAGEDFEILEMTYEEDYIPHQYLITTLKNSKIKFKDGGQIYADGGQTGQAITCVNCGWHWNTADSDEFDKYICHKCGFDNRTFYDPEPIGKMADGGELDYTKDALEFFKKELEIKSDVVLVQSQSSFDPMSMSQLMGGVPLTSVKNNKFYVLVDFHHTKNRFIRTLAHELVHVKQMEDERLRFEGDKIIFDDEKMTYDEYQKRYHSDDIPKFEDEAFNLERVLQNKYAEKEGSYADGGALGKSKVYYHGSNLLFKDIKFIPKESGESLRLGEGVYVTNDKEVAKKYGKYVYELISEEPLISLNYTSDIPEDELVEIIRHFENSDDSDFNSLAIDYQYKLDDGELMWGNSLISDLERYDIDVNKTLIELGYNSISQPINKLNSFLDWDENSLNINVIKPNILHIVSVKTENDKEVNYAQGGVMGQELFKPSKTIEQIAKEKDVPLYYAEEQLKKGMKTESEHSDNPMVQETIALQHLDEMIDYYEKLEYIENQNKMEKGDLLNKSLFNKALIYKSIKPIREANEIMERLDFMESQNKMANGGVTKFYKEYLDWYIDGVYDKMTIMVSVPNAFSKMSGGDNDVILDVFEKKDDNIDAKKKLTELLEIVDRNGLDVYLEPIPRLYNIKDKSKRDKITREYLIKYYENFGFELLPNGFMVRKHNNMEKGGSTTDETYQEQQRRLLELSDNVYRAKKNIANAEDVDEAIQKFYNARNEYNSYEQSILDKEDNERRDRNIDTRIADEKEDKEKYGEYYEYKELFKKSPALAALQSAKDMVEYVKSQEYIDTLIQEGLNTEKIQERQNQRIRSYEQDVKDLEYYIGSKKSKSKKMEYGGFLKAGGEINPDNKSVKDYFSHGSGNVGGVLVGKRHSEGGIKAVNKSTNQPLEMEGGEVVITRNAVSDNTKREFNGEMLTNREILSKINESGGGVSFADGGDIPETISTIGIEYKYGGKMMKDHEIVSSCGCNHSMAKGGETEKFKVERTKSYDGRDLISVFEYIPNEKGFINVFSLNDKYKQKAVKNNYDLSKDEDVIKFYEKVEKGYLAEGGETDYHNEIKNHLFPKVEVEVEVEVEPEMDLIPIHEHFITADDLGLSDGMPMLAVGTIIYSSGGNDQWELVSFSDDGVNLVNNPKSPLQSKMEDKHLTFEELIKYFKDKAISIKNISTERELEPAIALVKNKLPQKSFAVGGLVDGDEDEDAKIMQSQFGKSNFK